MESGLRRAETLRYAQGDSPEAFFDTLVSDSLKEPLRTVTHEPPFRAGEGYGRTRMRCLTVMAREWARA